VKVSNKVHDIHGLLSDMGKIPGLVVVLALLIPLITAGCVNTAADAREWNAKGETDHVMGRYNEAVAAYDQAVTLDPAYGKAWRNRGLSLALLNRTNESEESYQKALMIDPQDMEALYYQAVSRAYSGNTAGALESLTMTAAITPKNRDDAIILTQAYTLRGNLFTKLGRIEEANQSFRQAHETMMSTI
jgi:tetratricopeptide (TPR) repeat protein